MGESRPGPSLVNKVLLEHGQAVHLHIFYGCSCVAAAELTDCDREHVTCKSKNIYCLTCHGEPPVPCWKRCRSAWFFEDWGT